MSLDQFRLSPEQQQEGGQQPAPPMSESERLGAVNQQFVEKRNLEQVKDTDQTPIMEDIVEGASVGVDATADMLGGIKAGAYDALGVDENISNYTKHKLRRDMMETRERRSKLGTAGEVSAMGTQIASTVLPALGAGLATGGAALPAIGVAAATGGGLQYGDVVSQQVAETGDIDQDAAQKAALASAIISGATGGLGQKIMPVVKPLASRAAVSAGLGSGEAATDQIINNLALDRDWSENVGTAAMIGAGFGAGMTGAERGLQGLSQSLGAEPSPNAFKALEDTQAVEKASGTQFPDSFKKDVAEFYNTRDHLAKEKLRMEAEGDTAGARKVGEAIENLTEKHALDASIVEAAKHIQQSGIDMTALVADAHLGDQRTVVKRLGDILDIDESQVQKLRDRIEGAERGVFGKQEGTIAKHRDNVLIKGQQMMDKLTGDFTDAHAKANQARIQAETVGVPIEQQRALRELTTSLKELEKVARSAVNHNTPVSMVDVGTYSRRAKQLAQDLDLGHIFSEFDPTLRVRTIETANRMLLQENPALKHGFEKAHIEGKQQMSTTDMALAAGTVGLSPIFGPLAVGRELIKRGKRKELAKAKVEGEGILGDIVDAPTTKNTADVAAATGDTTATAVVAKEGAEAAGVTVPTNPLPMQPVRETGSKAAAEATAAREAAEENLKAVQQRAKMASRVEPDTTDALVSQAEAEAAVSQAKQAEETAKAIEKEEAKATVEEPTEATTEVVKREPLPSTKPKPKKTKEETPKEEPKPKPKPKPLPPKPKSAKIIETDDKSQKHSGLVGTERYEALNRKNRANDVKDELYGQLDKKGIDEKSTDSIVDKAVENLVAKGKNLPTKRDIKNEANKIADEYVEAKTNEIKKDVVEVKKEVEVPQLEQANTLLDKREVPSHVREQAIQSLGKMPDEIVVKDVEAIRKAENKIMESGKIAKEMEGKLKGLGATDDHIQQAMSETGIRDLNRLTQQDYEKLTRKVLGYQKQEANQLAKEARDINREVEKAAKEAAKPVNLKRLTENVARAEVDLKAHDKVIQSFDINDTSQINRKAMTKAMAEEQALKVDLEKAQKELARGKEIAAKAAELSKTKKAKVEKAAKVDAKARTAERDLAQVKGQYKLMKKGMSDVLGKNGDKDLMNKALWKQFNFRNKPHDDLNKVYQDVVSDYYNSLSRQRKALADQDHNKLVEKLMKDKTPGEQKMVYEELGKDASGQTRKERLRSSEMLRKAAEEMTDRKDRNVHLVISEMIDHANSMRDRYPNNREMWVPVEHKQEIQQLMSGLDHSAYAGRALKTANSLVFGDADARDIKLTRSEIKRRMDKGEADSLPIPEKEIKAAAKSADKVEAQIEKTKKEGVTSEMIDKIEEKIADGKPLTDRDVKVMEEYPEYF